MNKLEEQVSISNQNVLVAAAQYREARDQVRIARSAEFPTVSTAPSANYSRNSTTLVAANQISGTNTAVISGTHADYTMPVDVSYQADVWGSIRRGVTAAKRSIAEFRR